MKFRTTPYLFSILLLVFQNFVCTHAIADTNTWKKINDGFPNIGIMTAININSKLTNEVYVGTAFGGLYKSTNGANNWNAIANNLFEGAYIRDIVFNPKNFNEFYVATEQKGIFKTIDSGEHWQQMNVGLKTLSMDSLAINTLYPNELYATSFFHGIFKSSNGGENWIKIKSNLDLELFGQILVNPKIPNMIFLQAWEDMFGTNNIFKSIDSGEHWTKLTNTFYTHSMAFSPDNAQTIYASGGNQGLFISENAGETWSLLFKPQKEKSEVTSFIISPNNPRVIYLNMEHDGIYKTEDGGKHWQFLTNAFAENEYLRFSINPTNPKELFITTDNDGVFHSTDEGITWNQTNNGIINLSILTLATAANNPNIIYAGTVLHGLWLTRDGKTWIAGDKQFANYNITKIIVDPIVPTNLVMLVQKDPHAVFTDIYYSHDAGETWQIAKINVNEQRNFIPMSIAMNPLNPHEVFAGTHDGRIWKSQDSGETWNQFSQIGHLLDFVYDIVINPKNSNEMYIASMSDLGQLAYKSVDAGKSWTRLPYEFGESASGRDFNHLYAMTIDPKNPNILYASARVGNYPKDIHFYKTIDAGMTWRVLDNGLPKVEKINTIIVDPNNTNTLYVATGNYSDSANLPGGDGVYVSYDAGETWSPFNVGLNNLIATTLTLNQGKFYVGTEGSGVYVTDTSKMTAGKNNFPAHQLYILTNISITNYS